MKNILSAPLFFVLALVIGNSCTKNTAAIEDGCNEDTSQAVVKKPNIYLYPETLRTIDIKLNFPRGGRIIESIPTYNRGWHVSVDLDGKIDDLYRFLYYESQIPNLFQYKKGWIINQENLLTFFQQNMKACGFITTEITDFTEYWLPLLDADEYLIFPQYNKEINQLIELHILPPPESLLRVFYVIKENSSAIRHLEQPEIPHFKRRGFTVVEWGVILN